MNEVEFSVIKEIVTTKMKEVFSEIPYGIDHTLRVLQNAENLMLKNDIIQTERQTIVLSALLHDIGAVEAMHKYSSIDGKYQEIEGPAVAMRLLGGFGLCDSMIERVCYIVGNHHSKDKIDGIDFQIVWDADQMEQNIK